MRQQGDYDALKRRHEAETRKADEVNMFIRYNHNLSGQTNTQFGDFASRS
jgi:hypothetical protein